MNLMEKPSKYKTFKKIAWVLEPLVTPFNKESITNVYGVESHFYVLVDYKVHYPMWSVVLPGVMRMHICITHVRWEVGLSCYQLIDNL